MVQQNRKDPFRRRRSHVQTYMGHHGPAYSVIRNPCFSKYYLTVGDWSAMVNQINKRDSFTLSSSITLSAAPLSKKKKGIQRNEYVLMFVNRFGPKRSRRRWSALATIHTTSPTDAGVRHDLVCPYSFSSPFLSPSPSFFLLPPSFVDN